MGMEDYAVEVMREAAIPKRQAREAIRDRAKAYQAALERTAAGAIPTPEEAALLVTGPVAANDDDFRKLDIQIEDAVAVRLTIQSRAEQAEKRAEIQSRIDGLAADNAKAWEKLSAVDKQHAPAVVEARRVIAEWQAAVTVVATAIRTQEEAAKTLAVEKDRVGYCDHGSQLVLRREIEREQRRESALRAEASHTLSHVEMYGPTQRELGAVVAPQG